MKCEFNERELAYIRYRLVGDISNGTWHTSNQREAEQFVERLKRDVVAYHDASMPHKAAPKTRGDALMEAIRGTGNG